MRTLVRYKTPSGTARAVFHGDLPHSLTNKDAQRNGRIISAVEIPADDAPTDSELLRSA